MVLNHGLSEQDSAGVHGQIQWVSVLQKLIHKSLCLLEVVTSKTAPTRTGKAGKTNLLIGARLVDQELHPNFDVTNDIK